MTFSVGDGTEPAAGAVVLLSSGTDSEVAALLAEAAPALALALAVPLFPPLALAAGPDHALQALVGSGEGLVALPRDPGLLLADGSHWAQALGAWRQPCLLLVTPAQLATGAPAAGNALLQQQGVPLLGLIQWGEPWHADQRRRDGLPWLGGLNVAGEPEGVDLRAALRLRRQQG